MAHLLSISLLLQDSLLAGASYDGWGEPGFALTGYAPASYIADRFLSFDDGGTLLTLVGLK